MSIWYIWPCEISWMQVRRDMRRRLQLSKHSVCSYLKKTDQQWDTLQTSAAEAEISQVNNKNFAHFRAKHQAGRGAHH